MLNQLIILLFSLISIHAFAGIENHLKKVTGKTSNHKFCNIDFIYMINLDQRPEKLAMSLQQLHPYGISPCRFSAINGWELSLSTINDIGVKYEPWMTKGMLGTSYTIKEGKLTAEDEIMSVPGKTYFAYDLHVGAIGVILSHLSILKDAIDSGYHTIWVMEDDIDVIQDPRIIPELIKKLDSLVGRKNWDILFTDVDFRNHEGQYIPCLDYAPRPNLFHRDLSFFRVNKVISHDFKCIGARFGAHSMIVRRSGMLKLLKFYQKYSIFLAYDQDYGLPPNIHLYSLNYDVVSQLTNAITDNREPNYQKK